MNGLKSDAARKIHIASVDDIFGIDKGPVKMNGVQDIPLTELHPFKNHPFQVRDDDEMQKLVDSVREHGVLMPGIARLRNEGGYEIIAGHRRKHASELAGCATMPFIVESYDDDAATIIMVDTNIQREDLLPSERAFSYKMKLDAMKRQAGRPSKDNVSQVGTQKRSDQIMAEEIGQSRNQIQRYIRLTELLPDLLKLVDEKKFSFNPAVEVSYLHSDEQRQLLEVMRENDCTPSIKQAKRLKELSQSGSLDLSTINVVMTEGKADPIKVTLPGKKLKQYFPVDYTPAQMEDVILKLLQNWKLSGGQ
ncbi:ParB/RepB/Spo0J family partition protein [Caproicibacter fermentans]|uniref:ParB/RepB/Spo0J family partition protein n=1 Tax=Caproicibacter fermentans TaxID=2576756 RepID=A0A7G8TD36_9FIRM|nr:ParB/RepB/Spo0J family partition protein [Caproicibacter fermentans]QNK41527.1 ParB/RepB/Spo0J family partition protein [Caproicibacter fermentans]